MLISRALPVLRNTLLKPNTKNIARVPVRNSGGVGVRYRNSTPIPEIPSIERATDACYIIFWWWVCYKFMTSYDHLIGEYPYPDPLAWTDEELGVPPDDYEPPNRN